YPGYGTTLGNALRRVLLSSLPGAAITSVKMKGIKHEFSTIPNVMEDVIQIILNLKQVRFRIFDNKAVQASLKVKGEKSVNAGMIKCPSNIEVVNKEAHIATITSAKGEIDMEIEINAGIGYVPVERQDREKKEVGVIAIDAIYTPIKRVNYTISNMRVGKRTDFEKINLEVVTDGSLTPLEAFSEAVDILVNQFSGMKTVQDANKINQEVKEKEEKIASKKNEKIAKAKKEAKKEEIPNPEKIVVTDLKNLSTRTLNILEKNKIKNVGDIAKLEENQILEFSGMGAKGVKEIKKAIGDFGLNLKKPE
ncbi:MAG TPA: DNA-directed RNA polymerase subunit alpha, partial [Candidatus Moranbacteria bacterium]|nr:DNA-directed RNA polymerase subunit alpha [Candidatus Moranbacteria bacterium]